MIKREMTISEIINMHPETIDVFRSFGLDCNECQIADYEELEHGAGVHNVNVDQLLKELNQAVSNKQNNA
jgi:hybrid cluster-associated redox disulfide protein